MSLPMSVLRRHPEKFWRKVDCGATCWTWTGWLHKGGYGHFVLWEGGVRYDTRAHRAAWMLMRGQIPDGLYVCHRCDNRACVRPDHLFLGTPAENLADMARKERGTAKLSASDVRAIRSARGLSQREIARRYGVSQSCVCRIRSGVYRPYVVDAIP